MTNNIYDFNKALRQDDPALDRRSVDVNDIKDRIGADVAAFVGWLFSGRAICSRNEARIGNVTGEAGESLAIALTGKDAGLWCDHATGEGGDLIALYMAFRGYQRSNFQLALKELAKEYLGDPVTLTPAKWQPTVTEQINEKKAALGTKPKAENLTLGPPVESYGYYDRDGKVMLVVRRYEPGGVDERGRPNKTFRASPGFPNPRPLYRVPQIIQATHVVLTEGERKANALASIGIEATTAMGGAKTKLEMVDWSPIAGKTVTIWPDNDKAGLEYGGKVAAVLISLGCTVNTVIPPSDKPVKWDAYDCVQEGGDPHALIAGAKAVRPATTRSANQIPILSVSDLRALPLHEWIVAGWVPADSLGFIYGDPGCGKSFLALDWCLHLAYGMPRWHGGIPIKRTGPILYILQEGGRGIVDRIDAFKKHHGLVDDPPDFEIINVPLSFLDPSCVEALVATVKERDKAYRVIVVDTVSRVLPGADENLQKEMTLFIAACDRLRCLSSACVLGVHHAGKSGDMRGSTVLRGAGDFVFKLEKESGGKLITVTCEKLKDEEDGWSRVLTLEKLIIRESSGLDFSKPKTSLVVTGITGDIAEAPGWPSRGVCQQILEAISDAWTAGKPWSHSSNTEGRYAVARIMRLFKLDRKIAKTMIDEWLNNDILEVAIVSKNTKQKGLKVTRKL